VTDDLWHDLIDRLGRETAAELARDYVATQRAYVAELVEQRKEIDDSY
jgi:hypothetical protein